MISCYRIIRSSSGCRNRIAPWPCPFVLLRSTEFTFLFWVELIRPHSQPLPYPQRRWLPREGSARGIAPLFSAPAGLYVILLRAQPREECHRHDGRRLLRVERPRNDMRRVSRVSSYWLGGFGGEQSAGNYTKDPELQDIEIASIGLDMWRQSATTRPTAARIDETREFLRKLAVTNS